MEHATTSQLIDLIEELFVENRAYRSVVRVLGEQRIDRTVAVMRNDAGFRQEVAALFAPLRDQSLAQPGEQMLQHLLLILQAEKKDIN